MSVERMKMAVCEAGRPDLAERLRERGAGHIFYVISSSDGRFPHRELDAADCEVLNKAVELAMPGETERWIPTAEKL